MRIKPTHYWKRHGLLLQYKIRYQQFPIMPVPANETVNTAWSLTPGDATFRNSLDRIGDKEWVRTELTEGKVYAIIMTGDDPFDSHLYLYDNVGNFITDNDDIDFHTTGIEWRDSTILYKPATTGTFFIEANSFKNEGIGDYNLQIQEVLAEESFMGIGGRDIWKAESSDQYKNDVLIGFAGNDDFHGFRGADIIAGGFGDDLLRGGNGADMMSGGNDHDDIYGGFGQNRFLNSADGHIDRIIIRSDQFVYNYVYDKTGNSPNGEKADIIEELDANDQIWIDGVSRDALSVRANTIHRTPFGVQADGIGIYSNNILEAVYTGDSLNATQINSMLNAFDSNVAPLA